MLSPADFAVLAIALGGLLVVAWLMPRYPVTAVGVVFMLACLSDVSVKLPLGQMRLEQPALAGLVALTFWHRKKLELPPIKPLLPIIVAGLVYLGALTLSSFFVAPDPPVSIRVLAWSYLSMAGGLAAALLLAGRAQRALAWFTADAGLLATIGFLSAIAFALFAVGAPWIDGAHTSLPRVSPFVIEPNLYASLLAAVTPLAIERWRAKPSALKFVVVVIFLATLGLAVTRGAYIGLVAGLLVYFGLLIRLKLGGSARLLPTLLVVVLFGGIGLVLPKVLLNPHHAGVLTSTPTTNTTPLPPAQEELDTFEYRMIRVRIGLQEWATSPLIGTGAYSYGERHYSTYAGPEVIHVGPVLVLHDSGIIGSAGLLALLFLVGVRLWRTAQDRLTGPTAIAFAAASVTLIGAYFVTVALHFAITWLIFGGALAATLTAPRLVQADAEDRGPLWRLTAPLTGRSRRQRFEKFMRLMAPNENERVLDVGITDTTWRSGNFMEASYPWPTRLTAVAPAPAPRFAAAFPDVKVVVADGRALPFADGEFDIGYSNAVIEHVGAIDDQRRFAAEIARTCKRAFVCTPNRWFPIDPHTLIPFVGWLPRTWRHRVMRWTGNGFWATDENLSPLSAKELAGLFPTGTNVRIERQRVLGLTSVLIAVITSEPDRSVPTSAGQLLDRPLPSPPRTAPR